MAIPANDQDQLMRFTMAAKYIIYNADRMRGFMRMLGTKEGALQAVHTVLAIINQHRPIPPNVVPLLGINCYMLMVDVAQRSTKHKADQQILRAVIQSILTSTQAIQGAQASSAPATQPPSAPSGLIGRQGAPA